MKIKLSLLLIVFLLPLSILAQPDIDANTELSEDRKVYLLTSIFYEQSEETRLKNLAELESNWEIGFISPFIELLRFSNDKNLSDRIIQILNSKTSYSKANNYYEWIQWLWAQNLNDENYYFRFKAELYKNIDYRFGKYFLNRKDRSIISLGEVLWGGVKQDGIPPLRNPSLIQAADAEYLDDDNKIFGMYINGVARAYPKRILAWHEFFTNDFDGTNVAGVYCTLCGTVIAYDMTYNDVFHDLGTSGFLYGSNKLMYDKATQSLWSTIDGIPVIGDLVGQSIKLKTYPVVTTSWKEWRERHPETLVLSIDTGYDRDYDEGVAYNEYFNTDQLMFPVSHQDNILKNKSEVFIIRSEGYQEDPLALSIDYLKKKGFHQDIIEKTNVIAIGDNSGAARAYHADNIQFKKYKKGVLIDESNTKWTYNEEHLRSEKGQKLDRIPAHNIFWFAWYNAYPNTRLIK